MIKLSTIVELFWFTLLGFILVSALLILNQRRMIYLPQPYPTDFSLQTEGMHVLRYDSFGQSQQAFFVSKTPHPRHVWLLLGGNAALALQWLPLIAQANTPDTGYLLIDYPGYGQNAGYPSQAHNRQAVLDAYATLIKQYPFSPSVSIMGHSLGTAVAIDVVAEIQPTSLILLSPFTSMHAMAERVIGSLWAMILQPFLWDTYDSIHTLSSFMQQHPHTQVVVLHGAQDSIVPPAMGQALASTSPHITFHLLPGQGHDLPITAQSQLLSTLATTQG